MKHGSGRPVLRERLDPREASHAAYYFSERDSQHPAAADPANGIRARGPSLMKPFEAFVARTGGEGGGVGDRIKVRIVAVEAVR